MAKSHQETMTQCTFEKVGHPGMTTTAWVESKKVKLGYKVTFREDKSTWWKVASLGAVLPLDAVVANAEDWKRTRQASDI